MIEHRKQHIRINEFSNATVTIKVSIKIMYKT